MEPPIPKARTNKLWDIWNLRICILLSFSLQVVLLLFASMRQRSKRIWIQLLIWSIYLLADWIAVYGLGQAIQGPSDAYYDPQFEHYLKRELFVFWGQFFLLHLGGSDSMTSFSLVDSASWLKQLAGLLLQFTLTLYSFSLLIFLRNFKLLLPTILVFLAGVIRCGERVNSLLAASFDSFGILLPKPNPGPDFEEPGAKDGSTTTGSDARSPKPNPRSDCENPEEKQGSTASESDDGANPCDSARKSLLSGTSGTELNDSGLHAEASSNFKLFKVLFAGSSVSSKDRESSQQYFLELDSDQAFRSIEFELIFLHDLLHTKAAMTRSNVGIALRIICFFFVLCASIGFFLVEKHDYAKSDAIITYVLLVGTIALDGISCIIGNTFRWTNNMRAFILKQKRWSRSVFQYDMLKYCLNKRQRRVLYSFAGGSDRVERYIDKLAALWFSSLVSVTEDLQQFIFDDLKEKAQEARSQNGNSVPSCSEDKWRIESFNYMECLLIWHLATTLYCRHEQQPRSKTNKKICKLLSNYMFYLLVSKPKMLDRDFVNWGIAFHDTQAAIQRVFTKYSISSHKKACKKLYSIKPQSGAAQANGRESKSLLCDALRQLDKLINEQKSWTEIAKVWVELMCLAAIRCQPDTHAQQPSRGGELLTHIWLLINHLNLGTQFSSLKDGNAGTSDGSGRGQNVHADASGGSGADEKKKMYLQTHLVGADVKKLNLQTHLVGADEEKKLNLQTHLVGADEK